MANKIIFILLAVFVGASLCNAREISGIAMPESLEVNKTRLILNGAGIRKKFFVKLYVGGLYLKERNYNAQNIIDADEFMAIRLHITSSMITSEKMEEATREGFMNSLGGNTAPLQDQIEKFISVFKEKINEDDIYDLTYEPGQGTKVYKNNEYHSLIEGLPFKQALFGIWLGSKPAQNSLKNKMLGN